MGNIVKLTGIQIVSAEHDFDKITGVLLTPTVELQTDFEYEESLNIAAFTFTYAISNIDGEPVFRLKTKSSFSIENDRNIFLSPVKENDLLLLADLANTSFHHTMGIFSIAISKSPINQASLLQLVSPREFLNLISESLQ